MQSEFCCHIGLMGKFFCRICNVKGFDAADSHPQETTEDPGVEATSDVGLRASSPERQGQSQKGRKKKTETLQEMVDRVKHFVQASGNWW